MSRKSKRQTRRTTSSSAKKTMQRTSSRDFNPDYTYVIKDLKQIGTLAGTFFVIMVVLALILR